MTNFQHNVVIICKCGTSVTIGFLVCHIQMFSHSHTCIPDTQEEHTVSKLLSHTKTISQNVL